MNEWKKEGAIRWGRDDQRIKKEGKMKESSPNFYLIDKKDG